MLIYGIWNQQLYAKLNQFKAANQLRAVVDHVKTRKNTKIGVTCPKHIILARERSFRGNELFYIDIFLTKVTQYYKIVMEACVYHEKCTLIVH